jgi:hypothetical protein
MKPIWVTIIPIIVLLAPFAHVRGIDEVDLFESNRSPYEGWGYEQVLVMILDVGWIVVQSKNDHYLLVILLPNK